MMNLQSSAMRVSLLLLLALTACGESETSATDPIAGAGPAVNAVIVTNPVNASSTDTLVYFSFETRGLVPRTAAWDVALRRYEVRVNGGVSGTGAGTGYSIGNNKTATPAQVLAFTNQNTLAAFDSIRDPQIPVDSFFKADRLIPNANAFLNVGRATPTANSAAFWKVRRANGTFALVRVTAITFAGRSLTSISFESRTQTGTTLGATRTFTITTGSAPLSVDLATGAAVTPNGCNWDILISPSVYELGVNTACNVGTYPGEATPGFAGTVAAGDAPEYAQYLSVLTGPVPNSIEDVSGPFRYDLNNDQRLSPTFNTYLIRRGATTYKLQVIGYYGSSGLGGFPTLRYARIR